MKYADYLEDKEKRNNRSVNVITNSNKKSDNVPTLDDVFDKKKYYNPGKILSRLKKQLEKYTEQLAESEEKAASLQMELLTPELSTDFERLMEIQTAIDEENKKQESLLERMMETELELEEMNNQM